LCQSTRSRSTPVLGQDVSALLRFSTIPYRLSLSHFLGNKIIRNYYTDLNRTGFLKIRKKILLEAKRSKQTQKQYNNDLKGLEGTFSKNQRNQKKEIVKNLIISLEKRLDSSLLRLLNFKSLYTKKIQKSNDFKLLNGQSSVSVSASISDSISSVKNRIKFPQKNFTFLQVRQKIKHGLIRLNGKRVTCPNLVLKTKDRLSLGGFIPNFL
jgi:hypothetical protein